VARALARAAQGEADPCVVALDLTTTPTRRHV
jgi:hypothetical protein